MFSRVLSYELSEKMIFPRILNLEKLSEFNLNIAIFTALNRQSNKVSAKVHLLSIIFHNGDTSSGQSFHQNLEILSTIRLKGFQLPFV